MRESVRERKGEQQGNRIEHEIATEEREKSKEEEDLLARNIEKMSEDVHMECNSQIAEQRSNNTDENMEEVERTDNNRKNSKDKQEARHFTTKQISYKANLIGQEDKAFTQDLDELMQKWLEEEKEAAPSPNEEQRKLMEALPKLKRDV